MLINVKAFEPNHPLVLLHVGSRKGDLGGWNELELQQSCEDNFQFKQMGCENATMLISFTEGYDIRNSLLFLGQSLAAPVISKGSKEVADCIDNFLHGNLTNSLEDANVIERSQSWWSGSYSNGTIHEDNCNDWKSTSSGLKGRVGSVDTTCNKAINFSSKSCETVNALLCIAHGCTAFEYEV